MEALKEVTRDKNSENATHLEITVVVLVHYNIANNDYQHDSRVLYTYASNKSFGQLLHISLKGFTFFKTFKLEFSYILNMVYWSKFWSKHYFSY